MLKSMLAVGPHTASLRPTSSMFAEANNIPTNRNTIMKIVKLAVIAAVASLFAASCCPSAAPAPAPAPVSAK